MIPKSRRTRSFDMLPPGSTPIDPVRRFFALIPFAKEVTQAKESVRPSAGTVPVAGKAVGGFAGDRRRQRDGSETGDGDKGRFFVSPEVKEETENRPLSLPKSKKRQRTVPSLASSVRS